MNKNYQSKIIYNVLTISFVEKKLLKNIWDSQSKNYYKYISIDRYNILILL